MIVAEVIVAAMPLVLSLHSIGRLFSVVCGSTIDAPSIGRYIRYITPRPMAAAFLEGLHYE